MKREEIDQLLLQTYEDRNLSRGERRALSGVIEDNLHDRDILRRFRNQAFDIAKANMPDQDARATVDWLEEVIRMIENDHLDKSSVFHTCFSPGEGCRKKIISLLEQARSKVDICVFTITDDRISDAIMDAAERGVRVRIITDNDKAHDRGSDARTFAHVGIPLVTDHTDAHMHHKFAVFDDKYIVTGSYNWTRSAGFQNENIVVTDESQIRVMYQQEFDKLWEEFS